MSHDQARQRLHAMREAIRVMSHHLQPMAACKPCAVFDFDFLVLLLVILDVPHVLRRGAIRLQARGGAWGEHGGGAWGERGGLSVG